MTVVRCNCDDYLPYAERNNTQQNSNDTGDYGKMTSMNTRKEIPGKKEFCFLESDMMDYAIKMLATRYNLK